MQLKYSAIKIILINILFMFAVIGFIVAGPVIVKSGYHLARFFFVKQQAQVPFPMEVYKEYPWSKQFFEESSKLKSEYKDFLVMKHEPFSGETIKINENGIRLTRPPKIIKDRLYRYLFFGASIVWGYGAPDEFTIPTIFGDINQIETVNYADNGHVVRQSLAQLTNLYIEDEVCHKKNIILFINGPIEAFYGFQKNGILNLSTKSENRIQRALDGYNSDSLNPTYLIRPAQALVQKIRLKLSNSVIPMDEVKGSGSHESAEFVAETTVRSWLAGQRLAASFNDEFIAIFPPTYALGKPEMANPKQVLPDSILEFIRSVHRLIIEKIKNYPEIKFIDLTDIFNGVGPIYIDKSGHYSPKGNQIFAEQLTKKLKLLTIQK